MLLFLTTSLGRNILSPGLNTKISICRYFAKLLRTREEDIDYSDIPPTTRVDWEDAEVLLPVSEEEFRAIKQFISDRRRRESSAPAPSGH